MFKAIRQFFFRRKLKSFFKTLRILIDGLRLEGMTKLQARAFLYRYIDELLIARAREIKDKATAVK